MGKLSNVVRSSHEHLTHVVVSTLRPTQRSIDFGVYWALQYDVLESRSKASPADTGRSTTEWL